MAESAIRNAEMNDFSEVCIWYLIYMKLFNLINFSGTSCLIGFNPVSFIISPLGGAAAPHHILSLPFVTQETAEEAGYAARPPLWAKRLKVSYSS